MATKTKLLRSFPILSDPTYQEKKQLNSFDNFWLDKIRDKRDLPLVYFTLRLIVIFFPLAILLYMPLNIYVWSGLAALYLWMNVFRYKSRYTLLLHITSHRPWFKMQYAYLNKFLPWILGPLMGQSPETYFGHHLGMHHIEGNLEDDDSTTMPYQRDSKWDFTKYLGGFLLFGIIRLSGYFNKKGRTQLRNNAIIGELLFIALCVGLSFVSFKATIVVFIIPFITTRITMMLGNWAQHSFVDPDEPENDYKNSITCINHKFNQRCWNDGYHISHHLFPSLHYTDHPKHLLENKDDYALNKAFVFEGIEFGGIWFNLMRKDYKKLASHIVNINNTFNSEEELIELMKKRTRAIEPSGLTMDSIRLKKRSI